ncbi:hypothetical protein MM440_01820 [Arsenicicoccus piscis]|uniref:Membrane protein n=1 Tax=Arsenicicoccus piscis TaxID=673954 RepID=A0ABQ6HT80_9MICO|nr:hypothetical protein [Arsenicicoccus piscis]MCH8626550.1 hypothetical protein [Arsenicicoccus piscis]GMA21197.1 membrane protein [Arsenicicoccus piscis]
MTQAFLAALGATALYGIASVLQGFAARRASGPAVVRHPAYLLGILADLLAWALSLVAMVWLPLFVVQSMLAGSLAVAVVIGWPVLHLALRRQDWLGVALATAGLALVALCAGPESTVRPAAWFVPALAVALAVLVVAGLVGYSRLPAVVLAGIAGGGFAVAALAGRALMGGGLSVSLELLVSPLAWMVCVGGGLGTLLYARALERGSFGGTTAVLWVVESIVPGVVGLVALGDTVRAGWGAPAAAGVALSVAGCVVLALSPTQEAVAA